MVTLPNSSVTTIAPGARHFRLSSRHIKEINSVFRHIAIEQSRPVFGVPKLHAHVGHASSVAKFARAGDDQIDVGPSHGPEHLISRLN